MTLRCEGDRIVAMGDDDPHLTGGARIVNFENAFAIPGLIDCHVHMALDPSQSVAKQQQNSPRVIQPAMKARAEQMVRCGITTARDLGAADWSALALRDQIAAGQLPGPRLLCAGQPLTSPGGHCHFWGGEAGSLGAIEEVIARQLGHGVDWIKVMATGGVATQGTTPAAPQFDRLMLEAIVRRASAAGRFVAAHCHGTSGIRNAAQSGIRTIEHCSFAGQGGFGTDFDPAVVDALSAAHTWVSPTVNAGWERRRQVEGKPSGFFRRMSNVLQRVVAAGVPLIASTDAGIPGVYHHRLAEGLLAMQAYTGLDAEAVLRCATVDAAHALDIGHETGRLAPGLSADIMIIPADASVFLTNLLRPIAVFARGREVSPLPFAER